MTYQNTSEQFPAGATDPGTNIAALPLSIARGVLRFVGSFFGGIWTSMMKAAEASSRVHQVEALQAKSDEELARMGIKRDMIAQHVFRDLFYA